MISCPWTAGRRAQGRDIAEFPHSERRFEEISARPAVEAGTAAGSDPAEGPATPGAEEKARRRAVLYDRRARPAPG